MMEFPNFTLSEGDLANFCQRWQITELAVFGSLLREDFRSDSDVDVLVKFAPDARWTLLDFVAMQDELSALLGRQVDLVMREAVEESTHQQRRKHILESARVIYVA